jgi:hypothetical protein
MDVAKIYKNPYVLEKQEVVLENYCFFYWAKNQVPVLLKSTKSKDHVQELQ